MEFCFIFLKLFAHVQEITLQQYYMGVAYADLCLTRGVLLIYLPIYLLNLSEHYEIFLCMLQMPYKSFKIVAAFILFYFTAHETTA